MKRSASKKDTDYRQPTVTEAGNTASVEEKIVNNPPSAQKLALIQAKQQEADELVKINELGADMVKYIQKLASGVEMATHSAQKTGDTLENWERVFTTMGEMNRGEEKSNETWVRFKTAPNQH
ncbi:hypothetical protein [Parasitella parasitica]|uniref:Uncharacterized protein n=1 Tax=Parasitella parasitica TaxID=35722 RepID=A0A0B7NV29_9FUNG|nr:hypothetical protein [Parasitella parasitica]